MKKEDKIKVTVHKGHLVTLGERMYVEAVELIRELVNNAYDADATEVFVTIAPEIVVVEDNGSGMNRKDLEQYFTIGSEEKRVRSVSPKFGRKRIGQFGIGKFAALAAADKFDVETKKGGWVYVVSFDQGDWVSRDDWALEVHKEPSTPLHHDGTKVTLTKLKKSFSLSLVERYLRQALPLRAKKFNVFLNGKKLAPKFIPGRIISISVKTLYGTIEGEFIIASDSKDICEQGIECRVKQVFVKRELFGLEKFHDKGAMRITGFINADFLPLISGRSDFIRDSEEFKLFEKIMRAEAEEIAKTLKHDLNQKQIQRISQNLKEALSNIRKALSRNPEFLPSGRAIAKRKKRAGSVGTVAESISVKDAKEAEKQPEPTPKETKDGGSSAEGSERQEQKMRPPKPAVLKRIRVAKLGISVGVTSLGETGPEVFSDGNMIYINQDHPIYQKFFGKHELFELNLLRLLTQEIVLMKRLRIPAAEAYTLQSKLLSDAIGK